MNVQISTIHKGCTALLIPDYINITIYSGDLFTPILNIQCNIYPNAIDGRQLTEVTIKNEDTQLPIHILSFYDESVATGIEIEHMTTRLSQQSIQALITDKTEIPQTIIFDKSNNITHKLMMRIMILLYKSVQFTDIFNRLDSVFMFKSEYMADNKKWFLKLLYKLEEELANHPEFPKFILKLSHWLSTNKPTNTNEKSQ